jgi:NADPH:quinone reductase-like Zn-dependent oxidoreductase
VSILSEQSGIACGAQVRVTSSSEAKIDHASELDAEGGFRYDDPECPAPARAVSGGELGAIITRSGAGSWGPCLRAIRRGGTLVGRGDSGGADSTAEVCWEWRRIFGPSMASPLEYRAPIDHVATHRGSR